LVLTRYETVGCVGLRASLDAVERRKILCLCQESKPDSLVIQPIAVCSLQKKNRLSSEKRINLKTVFKMI
jgi:hypothetical protein